MSGNIAKKSFQLRMSKKVAELTQVVHMLFMKHHEKELELEALKEAYEYEIDLVMADARGQLEALTRELEDGKRRLEERSEEERVIVNDQMKIEALERSLEAEKTETQSLHDLLLLSKEDAELQRSLNAQELAKHSSEMKEKSKEVDLLKIHVADLERLTRYSESQTSHLVDSLRKAVDTLQRESTALREELRNSDNLRESLKNRNRKMEEEVKRLKRELAKRSRDSEVDNAKEQTVNVNTATYTRRVNYDRELERLREEIQRYRMELSNRETNYNRRFADSQPIIVHRRPISSSRTSAVVTDGQASKNAAVIPNVHHGNPLRSSAYAGQDRTLAERELEEVSHHRTLEDLVSSSDSVSSSIVRPTSSTNSSERLPHLDAAGVYVRRPALAKPQPSKLLISRMSQRRKSHV